MRQNDDSYAHHTLLDFKLILKKVKSKKFPSKIFETIK